MTESEACLTEYVSRGCRRALAKVCVQGIGDANPMSRTSPKGILAAQLQVSPRTINRWLSGGIQGCDVNIERLIQVAIHYSRADVEATLKEDLESHRYAVDEALGSSLTGGCPDSLSVTQTSLDRGMTHPHSSRQGDDPL